ncbi:MAG TPA: DUF1284 domain-containing protein, partial [bacterium]|nr:DUF1284 domain-containing protein [bacterium]
RTDVLCGACPLNIGECRHDAEEGGLITDHDARTLVRLGLEEGGHYTWADLEAAVARGMRGEEIATHCAFCRWEPLGVCAAGIDALRSRLAAQASGAGAPPAA